MKSTVILKRSIDAIMYILFLLLMGQNVLRGAFHEWMGIAVGLLFICHNLLNFKWYKTLCRGKYNSVRILQITINVLLIIAMILCMFSGILVSQYIFTVQNGKMIDAGRHLHLVSTAWVFVLINFHLGLHLAVIFADLKKIRKDEKQRKTIRLICEILTLSFFVYGIYQSTDRRFGEELFHLIDYQKEYDYSQTVFQYFIGTVSLSVPFIVAAHYSKKNLIANDAPACCTIKTRSCQKIR